MSRVETFKTSAGVLEIDPTGKWSLEERLAESVRALHKSGRRGSRRIGVGKLSSLFDF